MHIIVYPKYVNKYKKSSQFLFQVRFILNETRPRCILVDQHSEFLRGIDTIWSRFIILNIDEINTNDMLSKKLTQEKQNEETKQENLCASEMLR